MKNAKSEKRRQVRHLAIPALAFLIFHFSFNSFAATNAPPPETPREFFNAGTHKLSQGQLREAEILLESAVASQDARVQPPALYNLGSVRFAQGAAKIKEGPDSREQADRGRTSAQQGAAAVAAADAALADGELQRMVEAYVRGRGTRRDLRAASDAVRRALDLYGGVLLKWQRAAGDFKSAHELNPADADARRNGEVMDRQVARLVDQLRELAQAALAMSNQGRKLNERLKQLKGRIPMPMMPPGGAGGDEDEDDFPFGPMPGQQEVVSKPGNEIPVTSEQAGRLLDGFKLDNNRRLPMGQGENDDKPKDTSYPNW